MNIFVGNLAFSATDHDLRQLFEPYGVVDKVNILLTVTPVAPGALALWRCPTALQQSGHSGAPRPSARGRDLNVNEAEAA